MISDRPRPVSVESYFVTPKFRPPNGARRAALAQHSPRAQIKRCVEGQARVQELDHPGHANGIAPDAPTDPFKRLLPAALDGSRLLALFHAVDRHDDPQHRRARHCQRCDVTPPKT